MLIYRVVRSLTLLVAPLALIRALYSHDSTRWSYSIFLIYCGLLIATISKYAQENLLGQPRYHRFGWLLLLTSLALYLTYSSNNVVTFTAGWILSGWGAALLVNHFNDSRSQRASRKIFAYFLVGDAFLLTAAICASSSHLNLFTAPHASIYIDALIVGAGLIKSGMVPAFRWLGLTNEAPSPLSALLHAGIVNGFGLAILSFPSLRQLSYLIIVLGLVTIAFSLIMMRHRHDEKGKLANGTSMQMAYMAIEGALGLQGAVLLHIIGHGSYKSWSFLRVGGTPYRWKEFQETYLAKVSVSRTRRVLTLVLNTGVAIGLALVAIKQPGVTLGLAAVSVAIFSLLTFAAKLAVRSYLTAVALVVSALALLALESQTIKRALPEQNLNTSLILAVGMALITITIVTKFLPRELSLKWSALLLNFSPKQKLHNSLPSHSANAILGKQELVPVIERFSHYFEPGLEISTMVAQDPVSGLHSLSYQEAALELAKCGISAYQGLVETIVDNEKSLSRVIDTASWWTAEATHSPEKVYGPYSIFYRAVGKNLGLPAQPELVLEQYLSHQSGQEVEVLIGQLFGCDIGWVQYLLGAHPEWIYELIALRAAIFMIVGTRPPHFVCKDSDELEKAWRAIEEEEATHLLTQVRQSPAIAQQKHSDTALVMCIDVRSEKMRRLLESKYQADTYGFAGFFGADLALVTPHGDQSFINQSCPVILKPSINIENTEAPRFFELLPILWGQANRGSGALAMAEIFGLIQLALSNKNTFLPRLRKPAQAKETAMIDRYYNEIPLAKKVQLASSLLAQLPLRSYKEVIFVGHESNVPNNPFKSLYECGACGGNSGIANAYYTAKLLNDPEVVAEMKIESSSTLFRYAIHNTTLESLYIYPDSQSESSFTGELVSSQKSELGAWWQAFPEFGLSGNVGAIIAPRSLTKGLDLAGKYFLHDYEYRDDHDGNVLANILSGPGQVMQMINSQYNFTVLDSRNFSSGDKTRLNVFTQAGVLVGAGGALQRGMPWQAIGTSAQSPQHKPERLQIYIAAPQEVVDRALELTPLTELVRNGWIALHVIPPVPAAN